MLEDQCLASCETSLQKGCGFDLRILMNAMVTKISGMTLSKLMVAALIVALMAGCSPEINRRGYIAKAGAFAQVSEGMSKSEVEGILGSPSTTASVNFQGDSYYYISSVTQGRAFLDPVETDRQVIAVRFNKGDQVASTAQYGLQDGKIININTRKTLIAGSDFSIISELFSGIGAAPGGSMLGRKL
jgi:outer membrane protein assembly factor BamE (lipoprotein component of BamABCDE complex)